MITFHCCILRKVLPKTHFWTKFINFHAALSQVPETVPSIIRNASFFCISQHSQCLSFRDQGTASLPLSPESYLIFSNTNFSLTGFRTRILVSTFSWEMILQFPKCCLVWTRTQGEKNCICLYANLPVSNTHTYNWGNSIVLCVDSAVTTWRLHL